LSVEIKLLLQKFLKIYYLNSQRHSWCSGEKICITQLTMGQQEKLPPIL